MPIRSSKAHRILILGDSTSSSLGRNSKVWSTLLSERKIWASSIIFSDTSCPGNTAASSVITLIIHLIRRPFQYRAAVLYIGNCDRITKPYKTNKFSYISLVVRAFHILSGKGNPKKFGWNKLTPFEWNSDFDINLEKSGDLNDFRKQLVLIRKLCKFFRIRLIPIIPKSNTLFIPGSAKGNFLYYRAVGSHEQWEHLEKSGLYKILNCDSNLDLNLQLNNIRFLIASNAESEKIYCALNNYAVSLNSSGRCLDAIKLLESISNELGQRTEIFNFNLGKIHEQLGDELKYSIYLQKSLNLDFSSYRVDDIYADTVFTVFKDNLQIIDMRLPRFKNSFFLDHCHLNESGQILLADEIEKSLKIPELAGSERAIIEVDILNPEIVSGDSRDWKSFFGVKIDHDLFSKQEKNFSSIQVEPLENEGFLSAKFPFLKTEEYFQEYPQQIIKNFAKFPEVFTSIFAIELMNCVISSPNDEPSQFLSKEIVGSKRLLGQLGIAQTGNLYFDFARMRQDNLVNKIFLLCLEELGNIASFLPDKDLRIRTVMYWYFRESLMFGFQSDWNSYFDRERFRQIKEVFSIALMLESLGGDSRRNISHGIYQVVQDLEGKMHLASLDNSKIQQASDYFCAELERIAELKNELEGDRS